MAHGFQRSMPLGLVVSALHGNAALAVDPSFELLGVRSPPSLGWSVASGDLDGDGTTDLIVGGLGTFGTVDVVFGPASGVMKSSDADLRFTTSDYGAGFGFSIAAGETNGDAYDDLVVGAPGADASYVFLGPVTAGGGAKEADAIWTGGWEAGTGLAVVPDCTGDGIGDVLVGDPGTGGVLAHVYVMSGITTGWQSLARTSYNYRGEPGDGEGYAVAGIGDTNGDGLEDLAFAGWDGGVVYVIEGGGDPGPRKMSSVADSTLHAFKERLDGFGWDVAGTDYDSDGYADVFVAATSAADGDDVAHGVVYGFLGPVAHDVGARQAQVRWEGDGICCFGESIAVGRDIDSDGQNDALFGEVYNGVSGAAYVQLGTATGTVRSSDLIRIESTGGDNFGWDVGWIPDWSGDGGAELLIGAPRTTDPSGSVVGAAYVYLSDALY